MLKAHVKTSKATWKQSKLELYRVGQDDPDRVKKALHALKSQDLAAVLSRNAWLRELINAQ